MARKKHLRIGAVIFPIGEASLPPLLNVVNILCSISDEIHVITGNAGAMLSQHCNKPHLHLVSHKTGRNAFTRVINYAWTQSKILFELVKLSGKVDVWLFPIGGDALLPSVLFAKLIRKPVILALASSAEKMFSAQADMLTKMVILLTKINYALSSRLILYSENLIEEWHLAKYRDKISIAHEHFLDFDSFNMQRRLDDRDNLVGYIGRLSAEKGVLNFLEAIPMILQGKQGIQFLIGGDGKLRGKVGECLSSKGLDRDVKLAGWIPHDELPRYLNELKLLVLPSYTEGLPNILLEAMACGTPVLATAVGAIPDIIKDGTTGFIMKDNSPESIAEDVMSVLENPNLDKVANNARKLVEQEYTYKATLDRYQNILSSFSK